ncbi:hypothetical protein [uncultured Sulfitobacter sp.]|uniref:hypothetical protein n=1 Tax=uncultured Sulfitobacter sp. TaxID=191468 RepID=UPI0030D6CD83
MTWQPIDTAPKDGTVILSYRENTTFPGYQELSVVHWHDDTWKVSPTKDGRLSHLGTHWTTLPAAPEAE